MKIFFGIVVVAVLLFGGYLMINLVGSRADDEVSVTEPGENVRVVDGIQTIDLRAKGGYLPKVSIAKAGIPTVLRVDTDGTFDCSSAIRVPSLKVSENLPLTGTTEIDLGVLTPGTIDGNCGMGMYPFQITVVN
jgi:plastocyanin domain-containing protein